MVDGIALADMRRDHITDAALQQRQQAVRPGDDDRLDRHADIALPRSNNSYSSPDSVPFARLYTRWCSITNTRKVSCGWRPGHGHRLAEGRRSTVACGHPAGARRWPTPRCRPPCRPPAAFGGGWGRAGHAAKVVRNRVQTRHSFTNVAVRCPRVSNYPARCLRPLGRTGTSMTSGAPSYNGSLYGGSRKTGKSVTRLRQLLCARIVRVVLPTLVRMISRSFALPVYFTEPSRVRVQPAVLVGKHVVRCSAAQGQDDRVAVVARTGVFEGAIAVGVTRPKA